MGLYCRNIDKHTRMMTEAYKVKYLDQKRGDVIRDAEISEYIGIDPVSIVTESIKGKLIATTYIQTGRYATFEGGGKIFCGKLVSGMFHVTNIFNIPDRETAVVILNRERGRVFFAVFSTEGQISGEDIRYREGRLQIGNYSYIVGAL